MTMATNRHVEMFCCLLPGRVDKVAAPPAAQFLLSSKQNARLFSVTRRGKNAHARARRVCRYRVDSSGGGRSDARAKNAADSFCTPSANERAIGEKEAKYSRVLISENTSASYE